MHRSEGLDLVESFLVVAEELSFRRAAERLSLDQSALSRRIRRLEHAAGVELFTRTTREVALTAAGRAFYDDTRGLVGAYARAVETARAVAEGRRGSLAVAYMSFAAVELMPRALRLYAARRPDVAVTPRYEPTEGQKVLLAHGDVDAGFLIGPVERDDFEAVTLARDPLCVLAPPDDPLAARPEVDPRDLAARPLVLGDHAEWETYRARLDDLFAKIGTRLAVAAQTSNVLAIAGLVRAGAGPSLLPEPAARAVGHGLAIRPLADPAFAVETVLAVRRGDGSRLVRDFVDAARAAARG